MNISVVKISSGPRTLIVVHLLALLVAFGAGCAGTSSTTPLMESQENVSISANELRVRLYDYSSNFSGAVEQTADEIAVATDDPEIQRRTLQWKASATAEVYKAAFGRDPLGAYTDVLAFSKQMSDFMVTGAGQDLFGAWQPEVVATVVALEQQAQALGRLGTKDGEIAGLEARLDPWVEAHPLKDLRFIRESTTPFWAEYVSDAGGGLQVVGRMEDSMLDMVSRMDILAENFRKQARWEAQLMMDEALTNAEISEFLARVDTMDVNLERIRVVFDDLEPILARQILAMVATGGELVERERILAQAFWATERETMFALVEEMQADVFAQLAVERAVVMAEIEASLDQTMDQSMDQARSLIDHLIWRLAQLTVGLLLILALLVGVGWWWRSRQRAE